MTRAPIPDRAQRIASARAWHRARPDLSPGGAARLARKRRYAFPPGVARAPLVAQVHHELAGVAAAGELGWLKSWLVRSGWLPHWLHARWDLGARQALLRHCFPISPVSTEVPDA